MIVQRVKVFVVKLDNMCSITNIHMIEENQFPKVVL